MKWVDALKLVGPLTLSLFPATAPFAPFILKGIEVAEEMSAGGADKKAAALNIVKLGAAVTNQVTGKNAIDPENAAKLASDAIDTVVKATNEFHKTATAAGV